MKLGFTGTRDGWTSPQKVTMGQVLEGFLASPEDFPTEAHHGDCMGADAQFHDLMRLLFPGVKMVGHPGTNYAGESPTRAYCDFDYTHTPRQYLRRDRLIVLATDRMIATPNSMREQKRSGTWATVRMARAASRPITIVYPDGSIAKENA